jgi:hypothetical protein
MSRLKALFQYWTGPDYRPITRVYLAIMTPTLFVFTILCLWFREWTLAALAGATTTFGAWRWLRLRD